MPVKFFLNFLSNNILFYSSYLGPTGLIYLLPILHLRRNQVTDLLALAKYVKSDIEKNFVDRCHNLKQYFFIGVFHIIFLPKRITE